MREQGISNVALAKMLGITESAVRKLRNPDHRSHIGTVGRALGAVGRALVMEDIAIVISHASHTLERHARPPHLSDDFHPVASGHRRIVFTITHNDPTRSQRDSAGSALCASWQSVTCASRQSLPRPRTSQAVSLSWAAKSGVTLPRTAFGTGRQLGRPFVVLHGPQRSCMFLGVSCPPVACGFL